MKLNFSSYFSIISNVVLESHLILFSFLLDFCENLSVDCREQAIMNTLLPCVKVSLIVIAVVCCGMWCVNINFGDFEYYHKHTYYIILSTQGSHSLDNVKNGEI